MKYFEWKELIKWPTNDITEFEKIVDIKRKHKSIEKTEIHKKTFLRI